MATVARSAPLPESSALVEDPQSEEVIQNTLSLIKKILQTIPETHESCIHSESLTLNSSTNANLETMRSTIGIPSAPVLKAVSENFTLDTCLARISEGLQLHQTLLSSVSPRLENSKEVMDLLADIRDLVLHINKIQKMVKGEAGVQPTPTPVTLKLEGNFEVQVAAHLTLEQLLSFGHDVFRCLRILDKNEEQDAE